MTNQTSSSQHEQSRLHSTSKRHKGQNRWLTPGSIIASIVLIIAFIWALFPSLFTSLDPYAGTDVALQAPSSEHWMGTDAVGRDVYARIIYGTQQSLFGALIAVAVGLVLGTLLGLIAGARGGWIDSVIMRRVDVLLSIPGILLSLSIIIILGFGSTNAAFAVGMASVATFARLARSQVMTVAKSDFIEAAYGSGASGTQVLFKHILPNSLTPVIALATLQFGSAILQLAILGFLGYGAPPPIPEWGLIIADGRDFVATAWWVVTFPGLAIIAVVMAANHLSHNIHTEA